MKVIVVREEGDGVKQERVIVMALKLYSAVNNAHGPTGSDERHIL